MEPRLTSAVIVSALRKRAESAGGLGVIVTRGDAGAGGILLICSEKGTVSALLELNYDTDGRMQWRACRPQAVADKSGIEHYLDHRREIDPDLWVIELDIPAAARFAAEFAAAA